MGLILAISVTAASVQDRDGTYPANANANVGRWCIPGQRAPFTHPPDEKGFMVIPKRWVVELTHAWIEKARRLVMHHDRRVDVSEAWIWLVAGRQLLNRLTRMS